MTDAVRATTGEEVVDLTVNTSESNKSHIVVA
jgi:hypothetical protein